jgi:flagellar assembly factor FliW
MLTSNALVSESPAAESHEPPALGKIATRFGELEYDPSDTVEMPRGMPGFAGHQKFAFARLADPNHAALRVMQSLADPAVSFLVVPVEESHGLFGPDDLAEAYAATGAGPEDLAIALVVSVRRQAETIQVSANLRAPILIDTRAKRALQYVLSNSALSVRHAISTVQIAAETAPVK